MLKVNGYNVRIEYNTCGNKASPSKLLKVCQVEVQKERQKLVEKPPFEMLGNILALKGPRTEASQTFTC